MPADTRPAFIDFEASSLDLIDGYPIEVGLCLADGSVHSWLIRPHQLWQDWSDNAEAIHCITRERLAQEGGPVADVTAHLNRLLAGPVFFDAWTFDGFWLHRLYRAAQATPPFQLESVSMLLDQSQVKHWAGVRHQVIADRSEERRVGKECRCGGSRYD